MQLESNALSTFSSINTMYKSTKPISKRINGRVSNILYYTKFNAKLT